MRIGSKVLTKTYRTKQLAQKWTRRREDAYRSGEFVDPDLQRRTVEEYSSGWMAGRKLKPRTVDLYNVLLARRILPTLGATELRHLIPEAVRRW